MMQGQWQPHAAAGEDFGSYEFNTKENQIVARTAKKTSTWGIISIVLGILMAGVGAATAIKSASNIGYVLQGVVSLVVGISFYLAGGSLKAVTTTQGKDMAHLMQAMKKLDTAFSTQIIVALVVTVLIVLVVVAAFVIGLIQGASGG